MSPVAEAPIITDERLRRPGLYVVHDDECAAYTDDWVDEGGVDDASERPRLYVVPDAEEIDRPDVRLVRDAAHECFTQARYKRWLGSLSARRTVEVKDTQQSANSTNLLEKIHEAKAGSVEALNMLRANVGTATAEACFKDDYVTEVELEVSENDELFQFGQSMLSVHANALTMRRGRHQILQNITLIEALSGHRIRDELKSGSLDDNWIVVPSIVPDDVPEDQLGHKGDGYFLDSLTFVLQATTKQPSGKVVTQSGFMAGVEADENATFEERVANRFDIKALARVYEQFGFEPPRTAVEFLDSGILIPKRLMPNGVVDFMRWCDEAADEVLGRDMDRRPEDYTAIIEESRRREASLADVREKVIDDLLDAADALATPMDAVRLMWKLVKKHTVDAAFSNAYIDPRVFGREAAQYITEARRHILNGEDHLAEEAMQKAQETAVVSGCGGGASESGKASTVSSGTTPELMSAGVDKHGNRKFACPHCGYINTRWQRNELIRKCHNQNCKRLVVCK